MSLYDAYREQTKQAIYNEAIDQFRKKGYENTTIISITESVGIAKGTFYNFYESKRDILFAWAQDVFMHLDIKTAMHNTKTAYENLLAFVEIIAGAIDESQQLFRTFLTELLKDSENKALEENMKFSDLYQMIINSSADAGVLLKNDPDIKVRMIDSVLYMGIIHWLKGAVNEDLPQYLKKAVTLLMHGLYSS